MALIRGCGHQRHIPSNAATGATLRVPPCPQPALDTAPDASLMHHPAAPLSNAYAAAASQRTEATFMHTRIQTPRLPQRTKAPVFTQPPLLLALPRVHLRPAAGPCVCCGPLLRSACIVSVAGGLIAIQHSAAGMRPTRRALLLRGQQRQGSRQAGSQAHVGAICGPLLSVSQAGPGVRVEAVCPAVMLRPFPASPPK